VALEALYLGVPLVITDRVSARDVLSSACVVAPASPTGLMQAIVSLSTDSQRMTALAAQGRRLVESRFTIETYVAALEAIYDRVLGE